MVILPATDITDAGITALTPEADHSFETGCIMVTAGGTITPAEDTCYMLEFDQTMDDTTFTIDASGVTGVAIFAQHYPTEFERSLHYLKGPGGEDIEPVNEMPEPEEREKRWGAAIGAAFIVMVCTLIGVIFLAPLFAKLQKEREALVNVLASAFAVRLPAPLAAPAASRPAPPT